MGGGGFLISMVIKCRDAVVTFVTLRPFSGKMKKIFTKFIAEIQM